MSEGSWILRYSSCPTLHGLEVSFRKTIWCPAPILKSTLKSQCSQISWKANLHEIDLGKWSKKLTNLQYIFGNDTSTSGEKSQPNVCDYLTNITYQPTSWPMGINHQPCSKLQTPTFLSTKKSLGNILWMFYQGLLSTTQVIQKNQLVGGFKFQTIWKKYWVVKLDHFSQIGVKITNVWNHNWSSHNLFPHNLFRLTITVTTPSWSAKISAKAFSSLLQ